MKAKSVVSALLLLFVAASVVYLVVNEARSRSNADGGAGPPEPVQAATQTGEPELTTADTDAGNQAESVASVTENEAEPTADAEASEAESAAVPEEDKKPEHKLIAYYFHGDVRCNTCLTMEEYAREALTDGFPEALASGELEWRTVNIDEAGNQHFAQEYELTTSSLVLVDTQDGQQKGWKKLERVWELVKDQWEFQAYVVGEALTYLGNGS